ncbi:MAG TPA: adenylate/guanylate cyclase domain-containing protein, partial [Tepidisphaeraceae bacterium]|nr:adenylate/guanylate cyclase domain-containing protein [Tepidisphaeraceae bacterium]
NRSAYGPGDEKRFAAGLDAAKVPVIIATEIDPSGKLGRFTPPTTAPTNFGVTTAPGGGFVKEYQPASYGHPSLALAAVTTAGFTPAPWTNHRFWLHYYGPHRDAAGAFTFRYISAANVVMAGLLPKGDWGVKPEDFAGKIVLIGGIAAGTYDAKISPYGMCPGIEVNATAIENMIHDQRVQPVAQQSVIALAFATALIAACASMFPRRMWIKLLAGFACMIAVLLLARFLFLRPEIHWLDPAAPLLAAAISIILALGWSYFVEDRQSRFFLRALSQCVSPKVAEELRQDPSRLMISTEKRELTILFSDIAGFTDISEALKEKVGRLLNYYLDEMSGPVFASDGFLDKYIGDAVMAFWNAPLGQPDHAARACRAALAMKARLAEIQPQLAELGAPGLSSRIGINTGEATFGMMGSSYKFNYSTIGDPVNYASRLEGANKNYGSGIMLGEDTAKAIANGGFVIRKLDLLKVQGKRPAEVYELLAEGPPDALLKLRVEGYEKAFERYLARDWDAAERFLLDVLSQFKDDAPARMLLERVWAFRHDPPPLDWDGVYVAKSK